MNSVASAKVICKEVFHGFDIRVFNYKKNFEVKKKTEI